MNPKPGKHIVITGGAGYIGSLLTGTLLRKGYMVSVIDDLPFGGEALLAYLPDPNFNFQKADMFAARRVLKFPFTLGIRLLKFFGFA